ncbi:hypothetical protein PR048_017728 [Dryococelus australis]|uniref:Uncharacterized protein n=1 Tax=Dryococelus australis TaxID=614101 RepID=A0ABQ9HAA8_9NEOP|nr:hypothetical protein PR048_017728 [Dryococelus australis]
MEQRRNARKGKRIITEKARRPAASSGKSDVRKSESGTNRNRTHFALVEGWRPNHGATATSHIYRTLLLRGFRNPRRDLDTSDNRSACLTILQWRASQSQIACRLTASRVWPADLCRLVPGTHISRWETRSYPDDHTRIRANNYYAENAGIHPTLKVAFGNKETLQRALPRQRYLIIGWRRTDTDRHTYVVIFPGCWSDVERCRAVPYSGLYRRVCYAWLDEYQSYMLPNMAPHFVSSSLAAVETYSEEMHNLEAVNTLASYQGVPGSIPGRVTGYLQVGIVLDVAVNRWVFAGISHFRTLSFRRRSILTSITLIGSQDFAVKSRPNLFTLPLIQINFHEAEEYTGTVTLLASHQGEPGSIPGRVIPDFRMRELCRTMPLVGGFFSGISHFPALSFRRCCVLTSIILTGSQDLAVKSRPNLFTHSVDFRRSGWRFERRKQKVPWPFFGERDGSHEYPVTATRLDCEAAIFPHCRSIRTGTQVSLIHRVGTANLRSVILRNCDHWKAWRCASSSHMFTAREWDEECVVDTRRLSNRSMRSARELRGLSYGQINNGILITSAQRHRPERRDRGRGLPLRTDCIEY